VSTPTNPTQTDQHRAAQRAAGRVVQWTADWSVGRRIALFLVGLFQQFLHAGFFRMVLVPGYEWPGPIDPLVYLLTEALAVATSLGLLALPFVRFPGRTMQAMLMTSLALGVLANAARMLRGVYLGDFWFPFVCDSQQRGIPCGDTVDKLITDVGIHVMFGTLLYINLKFLWKLRRAGTRAVVD
jgi:hypothetical protein